MFGTYTFIPTNLSCIAGLAGKLAAIIILQCAYISAW